MKKISLAFLLLLLFKAAVTTAQAPSASRHKIAIFAPLYLDSAFDAAGNYRYNKTFPKFLNPGLEFVQGAELAADSLQKTGVPLDVYIYDSRSASTPMARQINSTELQNVEMIIGQANTQDVRLLAEAAVRKKVPFISATLPNDGGVFNNPYFVILNSTLRTHCESIYTYLQKYHPADHIVLFTKSGAQEEQIKTYFTQMSQLTNAARLKMDMVTIGNQISTYSLSSKLDSTRKNICIVGSLNEEFGKDMAQGLASISHTYPVSIIGMPTWDGINFNGSDFKDVEIMYTTPFYYGNPDKLNTEITTDFEVKTKGKPSDMYYRGYEVMLHFALLLLKTGKDVASNLTEKGNTVFTQFDIQPVFLNPQNMTLDYFENKKLYFVRTLNGVKNLQY